MAFSYVCFSLGSVVQNCKNKVSLKLRMLISYVEET